MKTYESVGMVIGALVGGIATGVFIYLSESAFSAVVGVVCTILGGRIGSAIKKHSTNGGG